MEMFRTIGSTSIKKYVVVKETGKSITFINRYPTMGGRDVFYNDTERRVSKWTSWHKTFVEAQNYLLNKSSIELKATRDKEARLLADIEYISRLEEGNIETIG